MTAETKGALQLLAGLGQAVWIDYLSRDLIASGELARLIEEDAVVGITSNPAIFEQALAHREPYEAQFRRLQSQPFDAKRIFLELACTDASDACDLLRPTWDESGGRDGYASIEVDPTIAYEALPQFEEASWLHSRIGRPNLLVKIPATDAGVAAIEDSLAAGRSINVTLVFSLARYLEVARAFVNGLLRLRAAGGDVGSVHSVVSIFISRLDTEADRRLDALGGHPELKGRLGIATAKLAYAHYREIFSAGNEQWGELHAAGAQPQRCLWASTSTKNASYRDVRYVEELIGPETISTMPAQTLLAFQDHGRVAPTLERGLGDAQRLLEQLSDAGLDCDDVAQTLEREGIEKFVSSYRNVLAELRRAGKGGVMARARAVEPHHLEDGAGGVVVVGVDESAGSKEALRFALKEAQLRGTKLRAVHAWQYGYVGARGREGNLPALGGSIDDFRRAADAVLDEILRETVPDDIHIEIERRSVQGRAASVLVDESRGAELLVVGSRGHGGFAGLLLGSVSQQCALHAHCPVMIVRASPNGAS